MQIRAEESRQAYFKKVMSQSPLYEGSILTAAVQSSTNGFPTVNGNGSYSRRNSGIDAGSAAAAALYSSADGDCSDCVVKAATAALQAHAVLATSRDVHSRCVVLSLLHCADCC
jgi:hypothetical protein